MVQYTVAYQDYNYFLEGRKTGWKTPQDRDVSVVKQIEARDQSM